MRWLVDLIYAVTAIITMPVWLFRMIRTGKIRTDWTGRMGRTRSTPNSTGRPRVLFHAVSVGEVNAIRLLIDQLAADPLHPDIVIAATTDTGIKRATDLWEGRHQIVRYPFDFSGAVERFLSEVQPDVVALVELEVWPNFTASCERRGIPVFVVNGRLTERSFRRYRLTRPLIHKMFQRVAGVAAQNRNYADRFISLGVDANHIHVTGTMKWDTAQIADDVPGAAEFADAMGIDRTRPLIVAGSTAPDEHRLLREAKPPNVQLLCAPRKPEWFNQAAADLPGCRRRSVPDAHQASSSNLFLLDTIGELRLAYALADLVIVGRSFGNLHGSDMMEPVALGKPTIVGPAVTDFQDTVDALLAGDGLVQTTAANLPTVIRDLLADPQRRAQLACNGRKVIRAEQGATGRTADLLLRVLRSHAKNPPSRREAGTVVEEKKKGN